MIILLSPSKTLDYDTPLPPEIHDGTLPTTQPQLIEHTQSLAEVMKSKTARDICELMSVSEKLGKLNHQRYQDFTTPFTQDNARPCIFAFKGDVYDGLEIEQFDTESLQRAQTSLRILSGLYGLLRPLDLMQPYRLEMGTKLDNTRGTNLYEFWGDTITELLNQELEQTGSNVVINLASNEYFKAVNTKKLNGELITPIFKEKKSNQLRTIGLFAKKARGMMAKHLLTSQKPLEQFDENNYTLDPDLSNDNEKTFTRPQPQKTS